MSKIIAILQRKGGVGKSTTSLNLACVLASLGFKVLLVDLDDQQNTSSSISGTCRYEKTVDELLLNDELTLEETVNSTEWENVKILPASSNLSGAVKHLDGEVGGHLVLKEKLTGNNFDYVIIDTSPSLNILGINALCACDYLFIPLSSKYFTLQGLTQTLGAFNKAKTRLNPNIQLLGMAFVIHDKRNTLANEIVVKVRNKYPKYLFKTIVGINIRIEEAQVKKQSILTYDPKDRGAKQYRELGVEIVDRIEHLEKKKEAAYV